MSKKLYCCGALDYQVESKACPVEYSKQWREYSIRDFNSTSRSLLMFCPNCGTRLPLSLRDEWFDILEHEYGLDDPMEDDKKKVPKEFLNDEWWKSRDLQSDKNENINLTCSLDRPVRLLF